MSLAQAFHHAAHQKAPKAAVALPLASPVVACPSVASPSVEDLPVGCPPVAGPVVQDPRSIDEADYDDGEDMKMFAALFEASDENRDTGSGDAGSSGENSTAASSRVAPEVEGADGETGIGDAAPAKVGVPAGGTGIRGDVAC